jgi:hypothetical protein
VNGLIAEKQVENLHTSSSKISLRRNIKNKKLYFKIILYSLLFFVHEKLQLRYHLRQKNEEKNDENELPNLNAINLPSYS